MFSRFFRKRQPDHTGHQVTDPASLDLHYIYVKGVAFMRKGAYMVCCDYTLPPDKQCWHVVDPEDAERFPELTQYAYALSLIEGAITVKPGASAASQFMGLN